MLYGSADQFATALRSFSGGKLITSPGGDGHYLPLNTVGLPMANNALRVNLTQLYIAGDIRANINPPLLCLTILLMRDHNRWCDILAAKYPAWNDETLYQEARRRVIAEIEIITFNEWLPTISGKHPPPYSGYNHNVSPSIHKFFSTAALRVGHTFLNTVVLRLDKDFNSIPQGPEFIRDCFFYPPCSQFGIDTILRGALVQRQNRPDVLVVSDVRNHLFGPNTGISSDLPSFNLQRGRDNGLPGYNDIRQAYGLPRAQSFADITSDTVLQELFQEIYSDVNEVDGWIGGLAEDLDREKTSLGPLVETAIFTQLLIAREADRFWYQNDQFSEAELHELEQTTLSAIIMRNTDIDNFPCDAFRQPKFGYPKL